MIDAASLPRAPWWREWLRLTPERWPLGALAASAALLAGAHAFERFGQMPPCDLCLTQREVHWAAAAMAVIGLLVAWAGRWPGAARAVCGVLGAVYVVSALVAFYHVGVEQKIFDLPATCQVGAAALLPEGGLGGVMDKPVEAPRCDEIPWSMLGVSMAGWNGLTSAGLAVLSLIAASGRRPGLIDA